MSFKPASKDFSRSYTFTNLELNGGYDCNPNFPWKAVDLLVQGGVTINKSLCVGANIYADLLVGDLCGNLFTEKITEKEPMEGIDVCGNLRVLGDIIPQLDNQFVLGGPSNKWANIYAQDVVVCGTLFANGIMNMVDGNLLTANIVCVNEYLATDEIRAKTLNANICISDSIDMKCGEIGNLQALRVDQMFGKNSPINFEDNANFRDGHKITFIEGVVIGNLDTTATISGTAVGKKANATGTRSIAIGYDTTASSNETVAIGCSASATSANAIVIGKNTSSNGVDSVTIGSPNPTSITANATVWGQTFQQRAWVGGGLTGAQIDNGGNIIRGNTGGGGGGISGNLDMLCNDISNVQNFYVDTVHGKASPWNSADDMNMLNGNAITWVEGIRIGSVATTTTSSKGISIGKAASTISDYAIALGYGANSNAYSSTAIGYQSYAGHTYSIALGHKALTATGNSAISIGTKAKTSSSARNIAIGTSAYAKGEDCIAAGYESYADNNRAIAIGRSARGNAFCSIAIGGLATAGSSIGIGCYYGEGSFRQAEAYGVDAIAIHGFAKAHNLGTIAVGRNARAYGLYSIVIGDAAHGNASNSHGIAMGVQTVSTGSRSIAIGTSANATVARALAIGNYAQATGSYSLALGSGSNTGNSPNAIGSASISIGYDSQTSSAKAISIGSGSYVNGTASSAIALGCDTSATAANVIAIGNGTSGTAIDSVYLGSSTPTNASAHAHVWGQIFQQREWVDGNTLLAVINSTGDIQKDTTGNVSLTGNLIVNGTLFTSLIEPASGPAVSLTGDMMIDNGTTPPLTTGTDSTTGAGAWSFTASVPGDWMTSPPTTVGEAINRLSAAVAGLLGGMIP